MHAAAANDAIGNDVLASAQATQVKKNAAKAEHANAGSAA
jgi:hypothetical protein